MKLKTLIKWQVMPFLAVLLTQGTCDEPVKFVYPIDNITVASGREAIFTCVVDKLQGHKVGWLRADRVLAIHKSLITRDPRIKVSHNGDNTWRLHIHDVQLSDSGPYMCTIKTDTIHVSQIGTLEVIEAPEILHNDTSNNTICLESADAVLNCETRPQENHPDNDADDRYWAGHSREEIFLESQRDFLPGVLFSVEEGNPVTLPCKMVGNPRPHSIEWLMHGKGGGPRDWIQVVTSDVDLNSKNILLQDGSLFIPAVSSQHEGDFYCKAANQYRDDKSFFPWHSLIVTKSDARVFLEDPSNATVPLGGSTILRCRLAEDPKAVRQPITWWYAWKSSANSYWHETIKVVTTKEDPNSNKLLLQSGELVIFNAKKTDTGKYECVHQYFGYRSKPAYIEVEGEEPFFLEFLEEPSDLVAIDSPAPVLTCKLGGNYILPTVEWWKQDQGTETQVITVAEDPTSNYAILFNGSLQISRPSFEDAGTYFCKGMASYKGLVTTITSKAAKLVVEPRDFKFLEQPANQTANVNGTITLKCQLEDKEVTDVSYNWYHKLQSDSSSIWDHMLTPTYGADSNKFILSDGALKILNAQPSDQGIYACIVADLLTKSSYTLESSEAWITIQGPREPEPEALLALSLGGGGDDNDFKLEVYPEILEGISKLSMILNGNNARFLEILETMHDIPDMLEGRTEGRAAYLDGTLYYCGGSTEPHKSIDFRNYGPNQLSSDCFMLGDTGGWQRGPQMNTRRYEFSLNTIGDKLVAIGGEDGSGLITKTTEILEDGVWYYGAPLSVPRKAQCTVTISKADVIMVGGYQETPILDLVEEFNIYSGKSVELTKLPYPNGAMACGLHGKLLVVAGGWTNVPGRPSSSHYISEVLVLDLRQYFGAWKTGNGFFVEDGASYIPDWYKLTSLPDSEFYGKMLVMSDGLWLFGQNWHSGYTIWQYSSGNDTTLRDGSWLEDKRGHFRWFGDTVLVPASFRRIV